MNKNFFFQKFSPRNFQVLLSWKPINMTNVDTKTVIDPESSIEFVFEVKSKIDNHNLDAVHEKTLESKSTLENQHKKFLEENYMNRSMQSFEDSYYQPHQLKKQEEKNKSIKKRMDRSVTLDLFGRQKSNGFVRTKVNPVLDSDFAYLNRNKLVNRRLIIRKNIRSSIGLQSFTSPYTNEFPSINKKLSTEFRLANPVEIFYTEEVEEASDSENDPGYENNLGAGDSQQNFEDTSNLHFGTLNPENMPIDYKNMKKRSWYTNEARKFYRASRSPKSSSVVIIERKSYKVDKEDGPGPLTYHIPRRPPNEKSAPVISMGKRTFKEKSGGGRMSWEKEWFNNENPFTIKTNYNREHVWPGPNNYKLKSLIGTESTNSVYPHAPMHTIGVKITNPFHDNSEVKSKSDKDEISSKEDEIEKELTNTNLLKKKTKSAEKVKKSIEELNIIESFNHIGYKAPEVSIQFRNKGTILWPKVEKTPGPGAYDLNKFKNIIKSAPKYSTPHARLEHNSNYSIGPYAF